MPDPKYLVRAALQDAGWQVATQDFSARGHDADDMSYEVGLVVESSNSRTVNHVLLVGNSTSDGSDRMLTALVIGPDHERIKKVISRVIPEDGNFWSDQNDDDEDDHFEEAEGSEGKRVFNSELDLDDDSDDDDVDPEILDARNNPGQGPPKITVEKRRVPQDRIDSDDLSVRD